MTWMNGAIEHGVPSIANLSLYRLLALLQGTFTETRDEQCACCIRNEHTCGLYPIH